jgi:5-bromo-4-chloroindolyl phosphate hydrolysis protein
MSIKSIVSSKTAFFALMGMIILSQMYIISWNVSQYLEKKQQAAQTQDLSERELAADNLKEYLKCNLGAACDKLYPGAAAAVKKAKLEAGVK